MRKLYFWKSKVEGQTRTIKANDSVNNAAKKFASNGISTTKYNIITFLPKNLFEQFRRLANVFFLILLVLQYIPQISSLGPISTLFSLILVLAVTAIKDAIDDIARHRSDREVNKRQSKILIGKELVTRFWKEIHVGDIIQLTNNEFVPADMVLISTSEPNGLCLIETAELDGETNLKPRQALQETVKLQDDLDQLSNFDAEIEFEAPNNNLVRFEGNVTWKRKIHPLKNSNVLLRGTRLRNTPWAFGIVCYAGPDTKLMQNTGKAVFKRTKIDHGLNRLILGTFFFLLTACAVMAICCGIWEFNVGYNVRVYVPGDSFISPNRKTSAVQMGLLVFLSYIILLNTVIPISLYISVEFIRVLQSKWIDWDNRMYYEPNNVQAHARTRTLNEELGQIDYIFSDKTGTLTQNIMTFKKCSIRGKLYGYVFDEAANEVQDNKLQGIKFDEQDENFVWYDQQLINAIEKDNDDDVKHFFTLLALCHTVIAEENNDKISYQAQSPDENALVSAARSFGFAFLNRTQSSITIRLRNKNETYDLLNILDFNNYRKRMSIIIRIDGKIILYCKGADSTIKERLDPSEREIMAITDEHLHKVASEGLRTLCLAWKELNEAEYNVWAKKLKKANTSMERREEQVDEMYEEIEKNLKLLGITAVEDKLQDGVSQCIERLTQAGIKIWMLTGDKVETAENVGLSCRLLTSGMIIKTIEEENENDVRTALDTFRHEMIDNIQQLFHVHLDDQNKRLDWKELGINVLRFDQHRKSVEGEPAHNATGSEKFEGFGLLITGAALVHAFSNNLQMKFLEVATMCKTVVCCRMTPLQKAKVVELVKKYEKKITLAIGDGANDVSMIQKAHIGVGISGQEGRQAVLASDYSIGQFRFLERLLLIHGRWSYLRISKFLRYFFYKNFSFTFAHFWFGFFNGFSAQALYDTFFVTTYNIFFSTLPILIVGIFDQDISAGHSLSRPHLYTIGQNDELFNKRTFIESAAHGFVSSCVIFFISYYSIFNSTQPSGLTQSDLQSFGFTIANILVIVVNLENALETWYWTGVYHFVLWGTITVHFILHFAVYSTINYKLFKSPYGYVGVNQIVLSTARFWLTLLVICGILLLPVIGREFFRMRFMPNATDKARLNQKFRTEENTTFARHMQQGLRRERTQSIRSGYAFSQQQG